MRIVHWYPNFRGGGGVANAVLGLASAQHALGHDVTVVAAEPRRAALYEPMEADGLDIVTWRPRARLAAAGLVLRVPARGELQRLRSLAPDAVHIHGEFNPDNLWALRAFDVPAVLSPQGAFHPVALRKSRAVGKRAYVTAARRPFYARLAAVHALSPGEAADVAAALGPVPSYTVPQGGNLRVGAETVGTTANGRAARLLFVGRLDVYTKGLDILLEAFAAASRTSPRPLELTIVGPDWNGGRAHLERHAASLGLGGSVRFTGPLPGAAVAAQLEHADLYIQLSRHEGLPLAVTEALVARKPALLSNAVGTFSLEEVQSFAHVRVSAPQADAAADALTHAVEELETLQAAANANADAVRSLFSWQRIAAFHVERYREHA